MKELFDWIKRKYLSIRYGKKNAQTANIVMTSRTGGIVH